MKLLEFEIRMFSLFFVLHIIVIESASSASAFNVLSVALLNALDAGSAKANQRDDAKSAMLILFYDW